MSQNALPSEGRKRHQRQRRPHAAPAVGPDRDGAEQRQSGDRKADEHDQAVVRVLQNAASMSPATYQVWPGNQPFRTHFTTQS